MEYVNINSEKSFDKFEQLYAKLCAKQVENGKEEKVCGCIHRIRLMPDFSFVILRTARRLFQCVHIPQKADFDISQIKEGDFVEFVGECIVEERSKIGYDFVLKSFKMLASPKAELPFVLSKKELDVSFDTMLDYRLLSLRNPENRAVIKIEEGVVTAFRNFFQKEGFTEFVAPKIVSAGAEGGSDMFSVNYFGRPAFLAQSPQVYKQMMIGVFEKVYTIGPVFRAEKSHTSRHITEFCGVDFEMGFIDSYEDIMLTESRALAFVFDYLRANYEPELKLLNVKLPQFDKIPQITFAEVKELIAKEYKRDYRSENDLEPDEEKLIGDYFKKKFGSELVFVTKYPSAKRPFYAMDDPEDERYTNSFDLLLNGTEITTGGQRIHDYDMQVAKMKKLGMNIDDFEDYLMLHKYGTPPHGGLGIGLERFVMKLLKLDNIRSACCFARDVDRLNP